VRKYVLLAGIGGLALLADQATKFWAVSALKHGCEELHRDGPAAPRVVNCHDERLEVDLGKARAVEVAFQRGPTTFTAFTCKGGAPCLGGRVRLGDAPPGVHVTRLQRDPVEQARLMFLGIPLETAKLTGGPDGQIYRVQVKEAGGQTSTLRFRYRSPGRAVKVIESFFHLRYVENPGAAWGFLAEADDAFRGPFFMAISVTAVIFILWVFRRVQPWQRLLSAALALVLGGAIGNLIDRVRFGRVVDFIDWHYEDRFRWPTFNVADAAITVGVVLLVFDAILAWARQRRAKRSGAEGTAP
jgi:signal peptidase II